MKNKKLAAKLTITLGIILIPVLLIALSLPVLGNFIVAEDELQHADIIVVLMGSGPDRMLGAVYSAPRCQDTLLIKIS